MWNELPEEVVEAGTLSPFKMHLDRYMDRKGLEGYGPNGVSLQGHFWWAWTSLGRRACLRAVDSMRICLEAQFEVKHVTEVVNTPVQPQTVAMGTDGVSG